MFTEISGSSSACAAAPNSRVAASMDRISEAFIFNIFRLSKVTEASFIAAFMQAREGPVLLA